MMKKIFALLFVLISLNVISQEIPREKIFISDSLTGESGKFYMEGKEIDLNKTFLDSKNIEKIDTYFGKSAEVKSGSIGAYLITRKNKNSLLTLQKFIEEIKLNNESIKNALRVNVVVDSLLINEFSEYKIEPSCVLKINIIIKDPKGVNSDGTTPTIEIITNKNNG